MAQRRTTGDQRRQLSESLRAAALSGKLPPGSMLPTVRELSRRHKLSVSIVSRELQALVDQGVLYTTPRVGTFVGKPVSLRSDYYLMLFSDETHVDPMRIGFEERVAELGASSLVLPLDVVIEHDLRGELPTLCGIFDFAYNARATMSWKPAYPVPFVGFTSPETTEMLQDSKHTDTVYFDDVGGGHLATNHLLQLGHKQIAFLGLHDPKNTSPFYLWSARRAEGWIQAMTGAGCDVDELAFTPQAEPRSLDAESETAHEAARNLIAVEGITAVVGANDHAIKGLFDALREANIFHDNWPAMVGFDDLADTRRFVLTSLRLPWEEVGRAAADFLWQRRTGYLTGPPEHRLINMKLIPRLTEGHALHAYTRLPTSSLARMK